MGQPGKYSIAGMNLKGNLAGHFKMVKKSDTIEL